MRESDDIAISENFCCYDVLDHICYLKEQIKYLDGKLQQIRKETIKEILLDLRNDMSQCYGEYALEILDHYIRLYGVEVEE